MRWLFLVLLMLNALYYIWHQQGVPLRVKQVQPLSLFQEAKPRIHLLGEPVSEGRADAGKRVEEKCLYLGGDMLQADVRALEQRLNSLDIQSRFERHNDSDDIFWLKISAESRRLVDGHMLDALTKDFPRLKSEILSCEGIASAG
jgi:hypothetical protein